MKAARYLRHLPALAAEALIIVAAYVTYSALRVIVEGDATAALENSFHIISIEQALGAFHEAEVQQAVDGQPWLAAAMRWIYLWAYLPFIGIAALVTYLRDRELFRLYRNTLFVSAAIGLVFFALLPVAPPRMLPEYGFADSLHAATAATSSAKNDFAAVPSYHCGFWLLAGLAVTHAFGWRPWMLALALLGTGVMVLSVVATANHFFIDAVVGLLVVMSVWSVVVARRTERESVAAKLLRPGHQRL